MRVFTRGDLDGLTSLVLLTLVEDVKDIDFAHPKDVQDGKVSVTANDVLTNLPYVKGCGMWFDHHFSEEMKLKQIGSFKGKFALAPSAARVIYDYYRHPEFDRFKELLEVTDRLDSGRLTTDEVINPQGWILLGLTLDPRTGLGPDFRKYFRWLVEYIKEMPLAKIMEHPTVKKRCEQVLKEQEAFKDLLKKHSRPDGNLIITDLRGIKGAPVGNRFLVFTLFPAANAEVRIFDGKLGNTVIAVGHSIFNQSASGRPVNIGELLSKYGGGGHRGAGTCQIPNDQAEATINEIIKHLKEK
ncbi:MAG: exopolyphosphatase [Planctomycetota bacterium]